MTADLTYDEVAGILAVLDTAAGEDLDFTLGELRIAVAGWRGAYPGASAEASSQAGATGGVERPAPVAEVQGLRGEADAPVEVRARRPGYYRAVAAAGSPLREGDVLGEIAGRTGPGREVLAPRDGRLAELCIGEGDFLEYGQVIAVVEPSEERAAEQQGDAAPSAASGPTA